MSIDWLLIKGVLSTPGPMFIVGCFTCWLGNRCAKMLITPKPEYKEGPKDEH